MTRLLPRPRAARPRLVTRGPGGPGVTRSLPPWRRYYSSRCAAAERGWGARWLGSEWSEEAILKMWTAREGSDTAARTLGDRSQTARSYSRAQIRDWKTAEAGSRNIWTTTTFFRWKLRMIGSRVARPRIGGSWTCRKEPRSPSLWRKSTGWSTAWQSSATGRRRNSGTSPLSMRKNLRSSRSSWLLLLPKTMKSPCSQVLSALNSTARKS